LGEQIYDDFRSSPYTALAIDEFTDITSEAQLLVYGKFACGCHIVEELWILFSRRISLIGVVSQSVDGAPSMMGRNIGFRDILQRKYPHIHISHCIIHREALGSNELSFVCVQGSDAGSYQRG